VTPGIGHGAVALPDVKESEAALAMNIANSFLLFFLELDQTGI
jgi:hypothetical protein